MKPGTPPREQGDLFRARLAETIDLRHELVRLAGLSDFGMSGREWIGFLPSHTGHMAISPRLVAGPRRACVRPAIALLLVRLDRLAAQPMRVSSGECMGMRASSHPDVSVPVSDLLRSRGADRGPELQARLRGRGWGRPCPVGVAGRVWLHDASRAAALS